MSSLPIFVKYLITFFISMVPIVELRGAIPIAESLGLNIFIYYPVAIIGNMLPVPIIYLFARKVLEWGKDKKVIGILNKIDLEKKVNLEELEAIKKWINISAKEEIGIADMEDDIYNFIIKKEVEDSSEKIVITNVRHKSALEKTKESIENIFNTLDNGMPMDLISVDLKEALDSLSEITGEISSEDLLDHVFKNFCVGK